MSDLKSYSQEWPAISRRLDEALALAPAQRDTWLDALSEPDSIKQKLRQLLQRADGVETGAFPGVLPQLTLGPAPRFDGDDAAGDTVGPYRLIRELGVGGMGLVWLAERTDGGLKRPVALKLPRLSGSRGLAERMSRERDILASLDHPNIARLYDAGVDEHGRPYLALEHVEGEAIDLHCTRHALLVPARLRLVLQVARAVAHAHARLVVHRDLKPANILVTPDGEVRLLDFGIAKLMESELTQETQLTQQGGRALTPDYASPEQIRGEPLGTASDVYSLGVVTYRLLTGTSPYSLKRGSAAELEEAIASIDPPLASTACTDKTLAKALRGDLDAVLNKALKKNAFERYATVDALIADIEAHLANRPVQAQPDRLGYRAGKFLRRHRWPVAAGSVAALALMASLTLALWQARAASDQRDRAVTALSHNKAITDFLALFVTETARSDRPVKLADMLERVESMADKQFRDRPDDRAVVLAMLGMYHSSLGTSVRAGALLQRARESASDSKDASLKARLTCQHASILQDLGKLDEARRDLEQTVNRTDIDGETAAECLAYLSYVARALRDGPSAVALTRRALDRLREVGRPMPMSQATLLGDLASGLELSGRYDEADLQFAAAMQLFSELGRETGAEAITVLNNWAQVSLGAGDAKSALLRFDQILALLERSGGNAGGHHELASRGAALLLLGRYGEALDSFDRAFVAAQADGHVPLQAYSLGGAGVALRELGELDKATAYLKRVEALDAVARPAGSSEAAQEHQLRARLALSRGDLALARREFTAQLDGRKTGSSAVNAWIGRAETGLREGRLELAASDAQEALRLARALQGSIPHSVRTGQAWLIEGEVRARQGDPAGAREAFAAAVDQLSHSADPAHPALKRALALAGPAPAR